MSLAPQLCHRLHTSKPTGRSWLGWPAPKMHGTLRVVRRPTMRQGEPSMDLSCNPHPCVVCRGATREPMAYPDDICRSLSSTSSSGSMASQGRPKLSHCKLQGLACRARCQWPRGTTGKNQQVCTNMPIFYPACCLGALGNSVLRCLSLIGQPPARDRLLSQIHDSMPAQARKQSSGGYLNRICLSFLTCRMPTHP